MFLLVPCVAMDEPFCVNLCSGGLKFLSHNIHSLTTHHLDAEWCDYIVISFHIICYASVAFRLHFSMSN